MIEITNPMFANYMNSMVDRCFKILPLYEERNDGLARYIDSMMYEFSGLQNLIISLKLDADFIMLISTFESLSEDAINFDCDNETIKREVFKCIGIIKRMEEKATRESGV